MDKSPRRNTRKARAANPTAGEEAYISPSISELYQRAEAELKKLPRSRAAGAKTKSEPDVRRLLHELQVHQIELEMQNVALEEAQRAMEESLAQYTGLYDFAPVAYFTLDLQGAIQQVNFAGARLLGRDRLALMDWPFARCLVPTMRPHFQTFLKAAFASAAREVAEFDLLGDAVPPRSISIEAECALERTQCRLVALDITERKRSEEARRHLEVLAATNRKLELEILHREQVESSLRVSERHQRTLLAKSKRLQNELRRMSHLILETQEEERKRISRELHDQITQTLVNISFHLQTLSGDAEINPRKLRPKIMETQKLVEESVEIVHHFARDLRPPALDHLGLIPALKALVSEFVDRTKILAKFSAFPEVEESNSGRRIAIYRVVQSALSNVAKHSEAANVTVKIQKVGRTSRLTIADDGKSFDKKRLRYAKDDRRLGLLGMRERVEMVGGSFEIRGAPGAGTTVEVTIPLRG